MLTCDFFERLSILQGHTLTIDSQNDCVISTTGFWVLDKSMSKGP
jgi:hypothetical protein